jgi:hypothetical protein
MTLSDGSPRAIRSMLAAMTFARASSVFREANGNRSSKCDLHGELLLLVVDSDDVVC